ncbi:Rz-like spanin [Pseudomonas phage PPPL-1]|uniref:Rz-like lysis protein n=1 Tax=Pseudomonas phage PPPL-1 TaxID=1755692 RepID=A0A0S2MVS0_9CAUD|nr:Rz-like spanin [Pseudomonas phage PPPL-1]ALO80007.1 Rz-like lysis protein [Pseudomonas phage PPPL-1]
MLNLKEFVVWGFLVAAGLGLAYAKGHSDATDTLTLAQQANQLAAARQLEVEREATQKTLAELSLNWKAQLDKAGTAAAGTIADLKSRNISLSVKAADGVVCRTLGGSGPVTDGRVPLRDEDAQFLVGEAKRADLTITALQGVIKTLQGGKQ